MAERFKKYLCVSNQTARFSNQDYLLQRIPWAEVSQINNLSDYDSIHLNLSALAETRKRTTIHQIDKVLDAASWADIISSSGSVCLVGDLEDLATSTFEVQLLQNLFIGSKDKRGFDYRRVSREGSGPEIWKYLDLVCGWSYSWKKLDINQPLTNALGRYQVQFTIMRTYGRTTYATFLASEHLFTQVNIQKPVGRVIILPPSNRGIDLEDLFVLQKFFGIATTLEAPQWVNNLRVPLEAHLLSDIEKTRGAITQLKEQEAALKSQLDACKRWYRLLYDDGGSLETIVEEGLTLLGASVQKASKVKDDYRLEVPTYPKAVVEIKGTHNEQFAKGALRQLAGWMDEATAESNITYRGIFIGNAARNDEPQNRGVLFDHNSHGYAKVKEMMILRTMDLYCLVILQISKKLNTGDFWKEFFDTKGQFDAMKYWAELPSEFQLAKAEKKESA